MGDVSIDDLIMEQGSKLNGQSKMIEQPNQDLMIGKESKSEDEEESVE